LTWEKSEIGLFQTALTRTLVLFDNLKLAVALANGGASALAT